MITNTKVTIEELMSAARLYNDIREDIREETATLNPVELVTPKGIRSVREKWLEDAHNGYFGNPIFEYDTELLEDVISRREALKKLEKGLESVRPKEKELARQFVWEQLHFVLEDALRTTLLAGTILAGNDEDSASFISLKYGTPSTDIAARALTAILDNSSRNSLSRKVEISFPQKPENDEILKIKLDAKDIKAIFTWAMAQYPAIPWEIVIDDNATAIDVRDKSHFGRPVIVIPSDRKVTGYKLAELIGHEIESHWRSSVNAEFIGALKCDDELVYEGLAVSKDKTFNRDFLGSFELNSAYYILAMREALSGHSFTEISKLIFDYLPESLSNRAEKAWNYTYRVFRGITDTQNNAHYAFTKDRAYFEGYCYAIDLEKAGKGTYLNFSTLDRKTLERLIEITDISDVRCHVMYDRNIQCLTIDKILKYQKYKYTQARGLVTLV